MNGAGGGGGGKQQHGKVTCQPDHLVWQLVFDNTVCGHCHRLNLAHALPSKCVLHRRCIVESAVSGGGVTRHMSRLDIFAHNKSGNAWHNSYRRSETVIYHKQEPHQQLRLLPNCTYQARGA
jgi:hypothetical protein